jgi:hypothetical protein
MNTQKTQSSISVAHGNTVAPDGLIDNSVFDAFEAANASSHTYVNNVDEFRSNVLRQEHGHISRKQAKICPTTPTYADTFA